MTSENTKIVSSKVAGPPNAIWILMAVLALLAFLAGLDMPLVGPDEPRYSQVAREMYMRGDLVTPTLGGYHWFEKPALLYWLQIAAYAVFGVTEFAARIGPALFGIGTVISLWILGRFVDRSTGNSMAAWMALMAATTLGIVVFAHGASFDIIVTFPLTAAAVSYFIFDRTTIKNRGRAPVPLLLFYFFIGVSLLAKGLIGIIFPFAIVGLYHLLARTLPPKRFLFSLLWGTLLAAAVAAAWYVPMYLRHGYEFVDEFFLQHHFQRFTSNKYQHPQPFYFFLWVLPLMTLPWLPFFGAAVLRILRGFFGSKPRNDGKPTSPLILYAIAWLLVPLVFFSVSGSKLPGYILPAVPAAVVLTAVYVTRLVNGSVRWRNVVLAIAGVTFAVLIVAGLWLAPAFAEKETVKSLIAAADERGFAGAPVLMYHTTSHNAEFYAAGRLVRDADGKLDRSETIDELRAEISMLGGSAVVLFPKERTPQITDATGMSVDLVGSNGELTAAVISLEN